MKEALVLMGTRPEVIKLAPVVMALRRLEGVRTAVCLSGQHTQMATEMLGHFGLEADVVFDVPRSAGNLTGLVAGFAGALGRSFEAGKPDLVVVQGDTTSAMVGAVAGFYEGVAVAHVEAGLRSFDLGQPFPEEFNRRVISLAAALHFCPTEVSAGNLRREGVPEGRIFVVGNTCIDALLWTLEKGGEGRVFSEGRRGVLVTAHRRENWDSGIADLCGVIARIAREFADTEVVFPVHKNPIVREAVRDVLEGVERVRLVEPMDYGAFARAMREAALIISDSGGVQEEALALGTPVLVARNVTERPEVLEGKTVRLTGTSPERLWNEARTLLSDAGEYEAARVARFPFGRGDAAEKIAGVVKGFLGV